MQKETDPWLCFWVTWGHLMQVQPMVASRTGGACLGLGPASAPWLHRGGSQRCRTLPPLFPPKQGTYTSKKQEFEVTHKCGVTRTP